jgi:hypothetical protein
LELLSWERRFQDSRDRGGLVEDGLGFLIIRGKNNIMAKRKTKKKTGTRPAERRTPSLIEGDTPAPDEDFSRDGEDRPPAEVSILPVVCPNCKSTRRKPFKDGRDRTRDFEAMMKETVLGVFYNRIIYRRTECLDCGQKMAVREFTTRPGE